MPTLRLFFLVGTLAPFASATMWDLVPQNHPHYGIASGQIIGAGSSNAAFTLEVPEYLTVSGGLFEGSGFFGYCVSGCPPGTTYSPSYNTLALDGSAVFLGTVYPVVDWSTGSVPHVSVLEIYEATPVTVGAPGLYTGSFHFVGVLCGYLSSEQTPPCDTFFWLTGTGTYEITVSSADFLGAGWVTASTPVYNFTVPEPSYFGLVGFLAATLGIYRRFRYSCGLRRVLNNSITR